MQKLRKIFTHPITIGQIALIVWIVLTLLVHGSLFAAAVAIPVLLYLPGNFLYRTLAGYRRVESAWAITAYSVGLSLLMLMVIGFMTNEIGLGLGSSTPLSTMPLVLSTATVTSLLGVIAAFRRRTKILRPVQLTWRPILLGALLPLVAVAGAVILNNGGTNSVAIAALALVGIVPLILTWRRKTDPSIYPAALYFISLALLLGTSMRGWNITGHDVMQEFQVFQLTALHSAWHMHYYQDAYNACLSITILPTVLQRLTGIQDAYIYKFLFQLYFALIAPIVYLSLRRFIPKIVAFIAAFVFISFPTFVTDVTMLGRQETAFLFLGLAILVGLDTGLKRPIRSLLGYLFLLGMVLAHYSTSYVTVGILVIATIISIGLAIGRRLFKRKLRETSLQNLSIIPATVVLATMLTLIGWNTLATQTSNNISATVAGILPSLPRLLTASTPKTPKLTSAQTVEAYALHTEATRTLAPSDYYSPTTIAAAPLVKVSESLDQITPIGRVLHVTSSLLYATFDSTKQLYAKLIQALILLGIILMTFSKRLRHHLPHRYVVLGGASLAMVALQVVLPSSVINYGLLRMIQQGLLVLAVPIVIASFWLLGLIRVPESLRPRVVMTAFVAFFLVLAGVLPALTGGYKPALALSNSGFYYEAYYTHQSEIAADKWLASNTPKGSRVVSDEFARRKMITYGGIFATPTLVPGAIPIDSYVYLSYANTTFGDVPVYYNGVLVFHAVPTTFLETNKNLVYSSGQVKIYK
jgi:uncharacterized membrane protein